MSPSYCTYWLHQKLKYPDRLLLSSPQRRWRVCVYVFYHLFSAAVGLHVECEMHKTACVQRFFNVLHTYVCSSDSRRSPPLAEIRNVSSVQFRQVAIQSGRERLMDGGREPPPAASASIGGSFLNLSQQVFPPCTS